MNMARQCWDETRHVQIYEKLLERAGGEVGEYPENTFLFEASCHDDPVLRVTGVNRCLEGLACDVFRQLIDFGKTTGDEVLAQAVDFVLADELTHVRFGSDWVREWTRGDPERAQRAHEFQREVDRRFTFGGARTIAREERLEAGFTEAELDELSAMKGGGPQPRDAGARGGDRARAAPRAARGAVLNLRARRAPRGRVLCAWLRGRARPRPSGREARSARSSSTRPPPTRAVGEEQNRAGRRRRSASSRPRSSRATCRRSARSWCASRRPRPFAVPASRSSISGARTRSRSRADYIYVSRGLLVLTNSEDELACVVGHEITHAAARHAAGQQAYMEQLSRRSRSGCRGWRASRRTRATRSARPTRAGSGSAPRPATTRTRCPRSCSRSTRSSGCRWATRASRPSSTPTPARGERIGSAAIFASTSARAARARRRRALREKYLDHFEGLMLGADPAEGVIQGSRFLHPDLGFALAFPAGWEIMNTPAAVVAIPQKRDARFALEDAGPGDDPEAVAEPYLAKRLAGGPASSSSRARRRRAAARRSWCAARCRHRRVSIAGQLTWVALGGRVYRLSAAYVPIAAEKYADRGKQFVRSLHPLTPEERASIMVNRLRLARAKAGETIPAFSARTRNVYGVHPTAIANGISVDAVLTEGQLMKIGVTEPYLPAGASPASERATTVRPPTPGPGRKRPPK